MDWTIMLILAVVCVAIGFLAAQVVQSLKPPQEPAPSQNSEPGENVEVVRLWRRRENGDLQPEVDGRKFQDAHELNAEQHARLSMALVDLYSWLQKAPYPPPSIEPTPADAGSPEAAEASSQPLPSLAPPPEEAVRRPTLNPFKALIDSARKETVRKAEPAPKSIAVQIDAILQELLEGSPLEERGIRLIELAGKGMVILVGMDQYELVDDVPDGEIKKVISKAVATWEARMLGGTRS